MGMAASQARFLGLTQRKSDVEYEGQQINQQRTALASKSAAITNQLLELNPPTAPSVNKFTKTSYSWTTNGDTKNTISDIFANPNGTFTVKYTTPVSTYLAAAQGPKQVTFHPATNVDPGVGTVTGSGSTLDKGKASEYYEVGGVRVYPMAGSQDPADLRAIAALQASGVNSNSGYGKYTVGEGADARTFYVSMDELKATQTNPADEPDVVESYKIDQAMVDEPRTLQNSTITFDGDRMTSLTINGVTVRLSVGTTTDEAAYNDAMQNYNYQKNQYDKANSDINSKTALIQQQDKTLELKLKQLDTDHSAIQTEMDAVKKVTDKNIEATFKTFGG